MARIKQHHPNNGEVMLAGYLTCEVVGVLRKRLRASIHRVGPAGTEDYRRRAVRRWVYTVPCPKYIWHIDGSLFAGDLLLMGVAMDGYSRM